MHSLHKNESPPEKQSNIQAKKNRLNTKKQALYSRN